MRALGYVEGQNLLLDIRGAQGNLERLPTLMQELIALRPDVIVGATTSVATVAQRATSTIPIVMLTAEISFKFDTKDGGVNDDVARRALRLFQAMQEHLGDWSNPERATKTSLALPEACQ